MTKKQAYLLAGGVILLAFGAAAYLTFIKQINQFNPFATSTNQVLPAGTAAQTAAKKSSSKTTSSLSATQAYLDAVKIYKNVGYYFQFVDCHGLPGSLTLKAGKKFMLDNRDGVAHKIVVQGGQSFNIASYGFAIATAPSTVGTHYITCDGGGAASILVQK